MDVGHGHRGSDDARQVGDIDDLLLHVEFTEAVDPLAVIRQVRQLHPEVVFILVTAFGTVESAVEAMKLGAYDYVSKPFDFNDVKNKINHALENTKLETKREYVDNCFLLDQVFRKLMVEAECRAITIQGCMGTIMPIAETSACLTLSTLNDDGWLAFCESDFVVIPSGLLLCNISGHPNFLNDPTYPHDNVITLAHCTGPRKMNGKRLEPEGRVMLEGRVLVSDASVALDAIGQCLDLIAVRNRDLRRFGRCGLVGDHGAAP